MTKNREPAAKAAHHFFYEAFKASPIGIALENLEGQLLFVNPALCSMFGFSEKEMLGKHFVDFASPEASEKDRELFRQLRVGAINHYQLDKRFLRRDGSLFWGRLSISLFSSGPSSLVVVFVEDITERKQAENKNQLSELRLSRFFETSPNYCYMISPGGTVLDVNRAALEVLGYEKEELIGKPLSMIYAPESQEKMRELFEKWKRTERLSHEEMVILSKQGQKRTVLLNAAVVRDAKGNLLHSTSVQIDITQLKSCEVK
jgi:PAS domain S-box-containing protein